MSIPAQAVQTSDPPPQLGTASPPALLFHSPEIYLHTDIAEQLLCRLCDKKKMTDGALSLFDASHARLRNVRLRDASQLTAAGLRTLRGHNLVELEAVGLAKATVSDLIGCLGDWSLQNLTSLDVTGSTFVDANKYTIVVSLSKLKLLRTLNVSGTEFNRAALEMIVTDLPHLENLDLSCTKVSIIAMFFCQTTSKTFRAI